MENVGWRMSIMGHQKVPKSFAQLTSWTPLDIISSDIIRLNSGTCGLELSSVGEVRDTGSLGFGDAACGACVAPRNDRRAPQFSGQ